MGNTYRKRQYLWLWGRCIALAYGTASAVAGSISLLGETSMGAILYVNATNVVGTNIVNTLAPQLVFIGFIITFIIGLIWATELAIRRWRNRHNPSAIFGDSVDKRLTVLQQEISIIKQEIATLKHGDTVSEQRSGDAGKG